MAQNSDDFLDGLVADLQPVRPLRQRTGMVRAIMALMAGPPLLLAMAYHLRGDLLAMHPDPMFLVSSGLFLTLALSSAWAAVDMARPWVGTRREGWGWNAAMAAVLPLGALALGAAHALRGEPVGVDDGMQCLVLGCGVAVVSLTMLVLWLRRGAPSSPRRAGLVSGVAAGAAGIFAVTLFCPSNELMHIGVWHSAAVAVMGLIGLTLVPRLIRW